MHIKVTYYESALKDIKEIYEYLCEVIKMPETATNQIRRIFECADSLNHLPERNKVYIIAEDGKKVRRAIINNYSVFYVYDELVSAVYIFAVAYNKCSDETILDKINR